MTIRKSKMQNVSFSDISELIDYLPEDERAMLLKLRSIVDQHVPQAVERLSFNVPYYKIHKDICFIWPSSVLWGKTKTYEGVRFGFTQGFLINDDSGFLNMGDRKQVAYHDYFSISEIKLHPLTEMLYQAIWIDEDQMSTKNKPTNKNKGRI